MSWSWADSCEITRQMCNLGGNCDKDNCRGNEVGAGSAEDLRSEPEPVQRGGCMYCVA